MKFSSSFIVLVTKTVEKLQQHLKMTNKLSTITNEKHMKTRQRKLLKN